MMAGEKCSYRIAYEKQKRRGDQLQAEIEALRAQVAELGSKNTGLEHAIAALSDTFVTVETRLTDALSLLARKGHDADCPAGRCSFVGFTGRCGESPAWHSVVKVGHKFQSPPCSDTCGLARLGVVCTT